MHPLGNPKGFSFVGVGAPPAPDPEIDALGNVSRAGVNVKGSHIRLGQSRTV